MWIPRGKNVALYKGKSPYQTIDLYQNGRHHWLALNNILQFHTKECYISHQYMAKYPLMLAKTPRRILVIGGGDGLAAREFLRHKNIVKELTNVELDPVLVNLTKTHPVMRQLTNDSFNDPRVKLKVGDGIKFLIETPYKYDIIIDDCEFDYTTQPGDKKKNEARYKKYLDCLLSKLNPGGVACIMDPLVRVKPLTKYNPLLKLNRYFMAKDDGEILFHTDPARRAEWMADRVKDLEEIKYWSKRAHVAYASVDLKVIGPECYTYISNDPIKIHRTL